MLELPGSRVSSPGQQWTPCRVRGNIAASRAPCLGAFYLIRIARCPEGGTRKRDSLPSSTFCEDLLCLSSISLPTPGILTTIMSAQAFTASGVNALKALVLQLRLVPNVLRLNSTAVEQSYYSPEVLTSRTNTSTSIAARNRRLTSLA